MGIFPFHDVIISSLIDLLISSVYNKDLINQLLRLQPCRPKLINL